MANCKNVECRGLPGNGRSEQESCCMMPAVFPVKTGSVAAHFSADLKSAVCSSCNEQASSSCCLANDAVCGASNADASCSSALNHTNLPHSSDVTSDCSNRSVALHYPQLKMSSPFANGARVISGEMTAAMNDPTLWESNENFEEISGTETLLSCTDMVYQRHSIQLFDRDSPDGDMSLVNSSTETLDTSEPSMSDMGRKQGLGLTMKAGRISDIHNSWECKTRTEGTSERSNYRPLDAASDCDAMLVHEGDGEPCIGGVSEADARCVSLDVDLHSAHQSKVFMSAMSREGEETPHSLLYDGISCADHDFRSHVEDSGNGDAVDTSTGGEKNSDCNNPFDNANDADSDDLCVGKDAAGSRNSFEGDDASGIETGSGENDTGDNDQGEIEFENSDSDDGIEFSSDCQFLPDDGEYSSGESDSDDSVQFLTADEIDSDDDLGLDMDFENHGRASPASPENAGMSSGYSSANEGSDGTEDPDAEASRFSVQEANRKWNTHYRQVSVKCNSRYSAEVVFEPQPKPAVHKPTLSSIPSKSLLKIPPPASLTPKFLPCFQEASVSCFTSTVVRRDGEGSVKELSSSSYSIKLKEINLLDPSSCAFSEACLNSPVANYSGLFSSTSFKSESSRGADRGADEVDSLSAAQCTLDASFLATRSDTQLESDCADKVSHGNAVKPSMEVLVNLFPTDLSHLQRTGDDRRLAMKEEQDATENHRKYEDSEKCATGANKASCFALARSSECRPVQLVADVAGLDVESCVSQDGVDYEDVCYNGVVESFDVVRSRDGFTNLRALLSFERVAFNLFSPHGEVFQGVSSAVCKNALPDPPDKLDQDKKSQSENKSLIVCEQRNRPEPRRRVIFNLAIGVRCLRAFLAEHQAARDGRCWMQCAMDRARERRAAGKPETGDDSDEEEHSS